MLGAWISAFLVLSGEIQTGALKPRAKRKALTESTSPPDRKVGVAAAHVQVAPSGVAKGRRGRLCAAFKHPGHLGKPRWLDLFLNTIPMNAKKRILTLDPELVADVRRQVEEWNEELLNPWKPSAAARGIVQTIKNSCPRMADALEAAGISNLGRN